MPGITDDQIEKAKSVGALEYLLRHEPNNLKRENADRYTLRDHDSLVLSNDKWFWFSQGFGGYGALDFLIKVRGVSFTDAVSHLTDGVIYEALPPQPAKRDMPPKPFTLPPASANSDKVYAYLRGRGIDGEIIRRCMDNGSLYQSAKSNNCVFVGFDGDVPKFACERGISDDYKKDVTGSSKRYSFVLPPNNPESRNLALTESPIDALSHATLHKMNSNRWDGFRLSLGGVGSAALAGFLERHPQTENILLCLDNDKAGRDATDRIIRELMSDERFSHIKITVAPPPLGKDYSDTLQAVLQLNKERTRHDRPKEAVTFI